MLKTNEIVATLENRNETATGIFVRDVQRDVGEFGEIGIGEKKTAERVAAAGIEAGGDQNEIGAEGFHARREVLTESAGYFRAAGTGGERAIERELLPCPLTGFARRSCSRIPGRLVRAEEEDGGIGVEDVLRAVTVVHVPIGDGDALDSVATLRVAGSNGDIVEQAEAHAARRTGVMAWRPHDAKCIGGIALHDEIDSVEASTRGTQGDFERAGADIGVTGAERVCAAFDIVAGNCEVLKRMTERQFVLGGVARRSFREREIAQAANGSVPALRLFRMPAAGVMLLRDSVGKKCSAQRFTFPGAGSGELREDRSFQSRRSQKRD